MTNLASRRFGVLTLGAFVFHCVWLSCAELDPEPPPPLVRIGDLLERRPAERRTLARDLTIGGSTRAVPASLEAPRVTTLEISAAGDADSLTMSWRLDGEDEPDERRAGVLHLDPDGTEHLYTLELEGNPAWSGRIAELLLVAGGGTLAVREITAVAPAPPYRELDLGRLLLPSLAGQQRLEMPLPRTGRATFEARLGLNPALTGTGMTATFRVGVESDSGEMTSGPEVTLSPSGRWQLVSGQVEIPPRARLVLETEVRRRGELLAPQLGFWGAPVLVFAPRPAELSLLVLVVDTLRADFVGAYGDESGLTPHIDELARRSIRFSDLVAPSPWTLPSLASLMTGLQPQTHGAGRQVVRSERPRRVVFTRLDSELTTLSQVLSGAGFHTAGLVNNPFLEPAFGLHRHWDEYRTFESETRAETVVDRAAEALERLGDRRFFLFVHLLDPHTPYAPSEDDCRDVARRLAPESPRSWPCRLHRSRFEESVPPEQRSWAEALYRAEVAHVDRQIGRLLATLEARGLRERTIVLFLADHGEDFWDHREQKQRLGYYASSDHGNSHYQELLHVPAILSVPGREPREVGAPAEIVDLFPTVLRYLGLDPPPSQGRDLGPVIAGSPSSERLRLSDFLLYGSQRWAARRGPWKLVVRPGKEPVLELYHLGEDPAETRDRSTEEREVVASLLRDAEAELRVRRELHEALTADDGGEAARIDERQRERLRALGYLE